MSGSSRSTSSTRTRPIARLMMPLCLLAVAVLWPAFAGAQPEPRGGGNDIAKPVPSGLWTRLTAMIQPPPGARSLRAMGIHNRCHTKPPYLRAKLLSG